MNSIEQIKDESKKARKPPSRYQEISEVDPVDFWSSIRQQLAKYIVDNETSMAEVSILVEKNTGRNINMANLSRFMSGKYKTLFTESVRMLIKSGVDISLDLAASYDSINKKVA